MKKNKRGVSGGGSGQKVNVAVSQPTLELESARFKLTRLDYILAPLFAALVGVWTFFHIWTARNWDDLFYMNLSQYTTQHAWVMNRYGHIYLQKFFIWCIGDVINGARVFWCFLIFSTCVLVYWCVRMLAGKRGVLIALIAVLFFLMQPIFSLEAGSTLSDFTVMFLVALITFIYLFFLSERGKYSHWIIMLLGFLFYWTVKSKETGICIAVLFLGLGHDESGSWSLDRFVRDIGWVCAGMAASCLLLMTLDAIFVGDALFSVRPSNYAAALDRHISKLTSSTATRVVQSWYTFITTRPLFIPFLLYFLIGWKSVGRVFSTREKMAWLFPLVLLIFLTFIRKTFYIIPRYFTPAIPVVCIWSVQFFRFKFGGAPVRWKNRWSIPRVAVALFLVSVSFILVCMFVHRIPEFVEYYKLDGPLGGYHNLKYQRLNPQQVFYMVAIMPSVAAALLVIASMSKKRGLAALFFTFLCLFLLILPPLEHNVNSLKQRVVARRSEWRFAPYSAFKDEIQVAKDSKILVSKDIHARSWMLGRDAKAQCHIFNIFFNEELDYDRFIDGDWNDIVKSDYTYAFITAQDWKGIGEKHDVSNLLNAYELKTSNQAIYPTKAGPMQIIVLKKR